MLPQSIQNLAEEFQKLDGVGRRSGLKLTLDLLQLDQENYLQFTQALETMRKDTTFCSLCHFFAQGSRTQTEQVICDFCRNHKRQQDQICLVEKPTDILTLEKSNIYNGLYHCLNHLISPLDNIFAENTSLQDLWPRIDKVINEGKTLELIVFFKAGFNSDTTIAYVKEVLKQKGYLDKIQFTRLAQGLPLYYNPDTLDAATMAKALEDRRDI